MAAEISKLLDLNVSQSNFSTSVIAKQGDTASRFLRVVIMSDEDIVSVEKSSTVLINAKRPDEESQTFAGEVNDDGSVTVPLTQWILSVAGSVSCSITIVDAGGRKLTTTSFRVEVEQAEHLGDSIADDENLDLLVSLLSSVASAKSAAEEATTNANNAARTANTAAQKADKAVEDYNTSKTQIENAVSSIESANVTATADAARALASKNAAENAAMRVEAAEETISEYVDDVLQQVATKADSLFFNESDGKLYLMANGEIIGDGVTVITSGGGSGGGSTNNAVLSVSNTTGWLSKTIAENSPCELSLNWSSLEGSDSTGDGVLTVKVGSSTKMVANISQGDITINVAGYLSAGNNTVKVIIADAYGNTRTINFSIKVAAISLLSTFDASVAYNGDITYTYIPKGNIEKTVHFKLDGEELPTAIVSTSGRQQTKVISALSHGSHTFEVYFTAVVDGSQVTSNHLYYDLICVEDGNTTPIIASPFNRQTVTQYETINIPYIVYNPEGLSASVNLAVDGTNVSTLTVSRVEQVWAYRADSDGVRSLTITCGSTVKTITFTVEETVVNANAVTDDLELYLSSYGRSNNEADPAKWSFGDINCQFSNYNWVSDGWQIDESGITVHRVSGDARLTIPLKIFASDFRTTGKTIEVEFATRDVLDYDDEIFTCFSGERGFKLTAQKAILKSESSEISTQYKENEHIRLTFVIEKRAENRLIYIYLNGIMCGATQYPELDDFSQATPMEITVGSNNCTIDLYNVRVYNNNLTRQQVLENWIADTQDIEEKLARYNRNNIYNEYGEITYENLPSNVPYLILSGPMLPLSKDEIEMDGEYVDKVDESRSFTFSGASAAAQGTSSMGYPRKNYKIKFKNFTQSGVNNDKYKLRSDSIPTNTFTFKADYASSEGANNVELVRLYNAVCPYKTPPQKVNEKIRQGIDGKPIVVFHNDGESATFVGKYNFNNDKGTPEVFGFSSGDESWETKNNTSDRVLFKSDDFEGDDWQSDFEARYPKNNVDTDNLKAFISWVKSTDQTAASNGLLPEVITYGGVEYSLDTSEYRLAKFKAELENHVELDSTIFYYLFTELFLMVDSRAKNSFPTKYGSDKFCWLPYDMDTAIGINNEGALVFGYELEDIDTLESGANIFNGQDSVFWVNLRQAFLPEIRAMYQRLRAENKLSYSIVEKAYEEHQATWCEAIWNEDAYFKYIEPLIHDGSDYLDMLQGDKAEQRKWWLYNRFRYIDSKYNAGDSSKDFITLRGYAKGDITIVPYADIYGSIKFGSYLEQVRALRGNSYTIECPLENVNDTEIYIYSASQLKSVGDLSALKVGLADFSMATKIQALKLGDESSSYENGNLTSLTLGNNVLLKTLDVRNCYNLEQTVDLSGCTNLEEVYFDGTAIKSVIFPDGGNLKVVHLPNTITNLTVRNQTALTDFTVGGYNNISTLWLENVEAKIKSLPIIQTLPANSRVRLIGVNWNFADAEEASAVYDVLDTMRGLDEIGNNTEKAQVSGTVHIDLVSNAEMLALKARYPSIQITYDLITFNVEYRNHDGELLHTEVVNVGDNAIDPVATGKISAPTRTATNNVRYTYTGFGELPTNIRENKTVYAQYSETYAVRFYNDDTLLSTVWVDNGSNAEYSGTTPVKPADDLYIYTFEGWGYANNGTVNADILNGITAARNVYAIYTATDKPASSGIYGVSWVNDNTTTMTRTDDAENMTFAINSSAGTIASDFDDVFPWNNATVETVDGNKMLHMPEMWFRITKDSNGDLCGVAVSDNEGAEGDWYHVDSFYYGCYGASASGDKLASVSGVDRLVNTTRSGFRTKATTTGSGYQQLDLYHKNVMMFLWWIEFATKNSESIMTGNVTKGSVMSCGGTDSVTTPSGFESSYKQMRWHYIEDFIGNVREWIDGISGSSNSKLYVCADASKFSDTVGATGYSLTAFTTNASTSTQCIKAYGWDDSNPFLIYPSKTTGGSDYTIAFCDGVYLTNSSNPCVFSGAYYGSSSFPVVGLSYVDGYGASGTGGSFGGRLLKIPS